MTTAYGTGFEMRSIEIIPAADVLDSANIAINSLVTHSGDGALQLIMPAPATTGINWVRFPYTGSPSEVWFTVWFDLRGSAKEARIEFFLSDGDTVGFRVEAAGVVLNAYRGSTKIADGTTDIDALPFVLLEGHVVVDGSTGNLDLSINGVVEHAITGNTQPGASSQVNFLRFYITGTSVGDDFTFDDMTLSDSAAPGDIVYQKLIPDSDNSITWTRSAGSQSFSLIDEVPPDDADYVETSTDGNQDLYTLSNYANLDIIPHIVQWIRGRTSVAGGEIKMQIKSGDTTSEESSSGLDTSLEYIYRVIETNPDSGSAWSTSAINALLVGQESEVGVQTVRVTQHIIELATGPDQQSPLNMQSPSDFIIDQGGGAAGGAGGSFDTIADNSVDGLFIYIAAFNNLDFPILIKISTALNANGTTVFAPGAGGRIGVQCGAQNADIVWVAGEFDGTNVIEKSEDAGSTFSVKDDGTIGVIRSFKVGPGNDNKVLIVDGDNADILETIDDGVTWTTINASVTPLINAIARLPVNLEEVVFVNQGGATNSVDYSVNSGANLEDFQTGVYPNTDGTGVIVN